MRYAIIQDNKVINIAVADPNFAKKQKWVWASQEVQIGWTYKDKTFYPPERNIENEWDEIRKKRDMLLEKSDVYILPDRWEVMRQDEKTEWITYRQNLRDITENFSDPSEIVWPTIPE